MRRAIATLLALLALVVSATPAPAMPVLAREDPLSLDPSVAENRIRRDKEHDPPEAEGHPFFLQRDPAGYHDSVNLYAFVGNDPVNHRDPTGRVRPGEPSTEACAETGNPDCWAAATGMPKPAPPPSGPGPAPAPPAPASPPAMAPVPPGPPFPDFFQVVAAWLVAVHAPGFHDPHSHSNGAQTQAEQPASPSGAAEQPHQQPPPATAPGPGPAAPDKKEALKPPKRRRLRSNPEGEPNKEDCLNAAEHPTIWEYMCNRIEDVQIRTLCKKKQYEPSKQQRINWCNDTFDST